MKIKRFALLCLLSFVALNGLFAQDGLVFDKTKSVEKIERSENTDYNKTTIAPKYKFYSALPASFDHSLNKSSSKHELGKRVANLKEMIEDYYIKKEDVVPGDPMMRTIVLKPRVYYAIRKIEGHLKKEVKNGLITKEMAASKLSHIMEVALSLIYNGEEERTPFEIALAQTKKLDDQLSLFNDVTIENIYVQ